MKQSSLNHCVRIVLGGVVAFQAMALVTVQAAPAAAPIADNGPIVGESAKVDESAPLAQMSAPAVNGLIQPRQGPLRRFRAGNTSSSTQQENPGADAEPAVGQVEKAECGVFHGLNRGLLLGGRHARVPVCPTSWWR